MGYICNFKDNEIYGTDDINAAISRLTTKGVTIYPTDENLINAMNGVTSAVAASGVDYNEYSCLVSIENESIKISPGTAFFEDGMSIVIDSEGYSLPLEYNVYVYLYRDINRNDGYPCVSAELPENNYVLLAYIDEQGGIADKREYAVSKLAPNSAIETLSFFADISYGLRTSPETPLASFNIGYTTYKHVIVTSSKYRICGYLILPENDYSDYAYFYDGSKIRFKKTGTKLELFINPCGDIGEVPNLEIIVF